MYYNAKNMSERNKMLLLSSPSSYNHKYKLKTHRHFNTQWLDNQETRERKTILRDIKNRVTFKIE